MVITHGVVAPVATEAAAVAPPASTRSSTMNSMSAVGETFARWVQPVPAVNVRE